MIEKEGEDEMKFTLHLNDYWLSRGVNLATSPATLNGYLINLFSLYKFVCKRGGGRAVTNKDAWRHIAEELKCGGAEMAAEMKKLYWRFLWPYEQRYYFGHEPYNQDYDILPEKKKHLFREEEPKPEVYVNKSQISTIQTKSTYARDSQLGETEVPSQTLLDDLCKFYERQLRTKSIHYMKKEKLAPTQAEIKRIIFGLESKIKSEVYFGLNMLLLYSAFSLTNQLVYDEFPNLVYSLNTYTTSVWPNKNDSNIEYLRTVTLIIRNFTLNTNYLQMLLKSSLFPTLVKMYNTGADRYCSRNIVYIMTGLVKVGWDCNEIVRQLKEALDKENMEDLEMNMELIRGLTDYRYENVANVIMNNIDIFVRIFAISSNEIREMVLEIFAFLSYINTSTRLSLAKNPFLIYRLIDILTQGMQQQDKLCHLSALILSNISVAPGALDNIRLFERELVMIATSDERIGNIAAGILSELDNY